MSDFRDHEPTAPAPFRPDQLADRSTIRITLNAKGDAQWEIKVVEGTPQEELDRIHRLAKERHEQYLRDLRPGAGS